MDSFWTTQNHLNGFSILCYIVILSLYLALGYQSSYHSCFRTEEERKRADIELKECVYEKTKDANLAELMYHGIRVGGSAYFPTWYRWGYGWTYSRGYKPLSPEEEKLVREKIIEHRNAEDSTESDSQRINESHPAK